MHPPICGPQIGGQYTICGRFSGHEKSTNRVFKMKWRIKKMENSLVHKIISYCILNFRFLFYIIFITLYNISIIFRKLFTDNMNFSNFFLPIFMLYQHEHVVVSEFWYFSTKFQNIFTSLLSGRRKKELSLKNRVLKNFGKRVFLRNNGKFSEK